MSVSNFTRERPVVVIALSVGVCVVLPLIVSSQQAGRFFQSLGTGSDAVILFLTACAIIFSSPTIAVLSAHVAGSWLRVLAIVTCCLIAVFSVTTTTIAINNKTGNKINAEARQSETGRALSSSIAANIRAIEGLQEQIDARDPTRWATKRGQWADQIQRLQYQNMELIRQQKEHTENGSGSSTGETFARLAEWGITRFGFAVFAAFLLDLIPFVTCLIIGTMLARGIHRRVQGGGLYDFQEVPPTKKPQPQRAAA